MNQFIYKALNDRELNDGEFRLYMLIKELGNNNAGYCYATNSYLAKVLGKHEKSISRLISPLIEKGYLYMIALEKGNAVEERRLYTEESYKTYLEDLQSYESKKTMKTYCLKEKTEDGDETTVTVNERNYKEYTGNRNATSNKNVTGTGNNIEDGTGNNIVTENIYNINNNNINNIIGIRSEVEKYLPQTPEFEKDTYTKSLVETGWRMGTIIVFLEFLQHCERGGIKTTQGRLNIVIRKLEECASEEEAIDWLEEMTLKGWKGLFDRNTKRGSGKKKDPSDLLWEV